MSQASASSVARPAGMRWLCERAPAKRILLQTVLPPPRWNCTQNGSLSNRRNVQDHLLRHRRPQKKRLVVVAAQLDPYELLGVSRSATVDEIKRAYRKKALKLHPDVNKAPDAKDRFMECKNAYQDILDERERGNGSAWGKSNAAGSAWSSWGQSYGANRASSSDGRYGSGQQRAPQPEENYSFEEFVRDLEKEFSEFSKQRRAAAGGQARMKSLWEELADIGKDIGEEFVEFLEQELGLPSEEGSPERTEPQQPTSASGNSSSSSSSGSAGSAWQQQQQPRRPPPATEPPRKSRAEEVEDELQALKRKMGLK